MELPIIGRDERDPIKVNTLILALRQSLVQTSPREVLTAARTYHVATSGGGGSDANNGLTAATPFLTIQKAINALLTIDGGGFAGSVSVADGTYTGGVAISQPFVGFSSVTILGNIATPTNVLWSTTGGTINLSGGARLNLAGFDLRSSAGNILDVDAGSAARIVGNTRFGTSGNSSTDLVARNNATIDLVSPYSIAGNRFAHMYTINGGRIQNVIKTVTISSVTVQSAFVFADVDSSQTVFGLNVTAPVTGRGAHAQAGGIIFTNFNPAWTPPGTYPGTVANTQDGVGRII